MRRYGAGMASDTIPARRERDALCDLFVELGPDQPTLCGDWTTRDLAAHLVVRERRPDAAIGIVISKAAGYTDKVQSVFAVVDLQVPCAAAVVVHPRAAPILAGVNGMYYYM